MSKYTHTQTRTKLDITIASCIDLFDGEVYGKEVGTRQFLGGGVRSSPQGTLVALSFALLSPTLMKLRGEV